LPILTDKIECNGIQNNWKIFFRIPDENDNGLKAFTFRIKSPLIPPEIIEDNVDFTPQEKDKVKEFAYDFSYFAYE